MLREGHIDGGAEVGAMPPISFAVTSTWVLVAAVASRNNAVALEAYLHILRIFESWFWRPLSDGKAVVEDQNISSKGVDTGVDTGNNSRSPSSRVFPAVLPGMFFYHQPSFRCCTYSAVSNTLALNVEEWKS